MKKIHFIDLFAGLGGFRIALENLGGKCVFSSEIDKYAQETYYLNFKEYPHGDITKIDANSIPDHDILCAGFPCQPFSIAGKRLGFEDTRGTLFFDVARILKAKKPKAFILENVAGIVNHNKGETLRIIKETLEELGYNCQYKIINAKDVGIPQNRSRWYCIGVKGYENHHIPFSFPKVRKLQTTLEDLLDKKEKKEYQITNTAKENVLFHLQYYKRKGQNKILIANEVRKSRCHFREDGISPCLTAKMGTGGNNVPIIVKNMRRMTEAECLRLMGFPKKYKIKANNHQSYKQIGNSVIVPIIEEIAKELISIIHQ